MENQDLFFEFKPEQICNMLNNQKHTEAFHYLLLRTYSLTTTEE